MMELAPLPPLLWTMQKLQNLRENKEINREIEVRYTTPPAHTHTHGIGFS